MVSVPRIRYSPSLPVGPECVISQSWNVKFVPWLASRLNFLTITSLEFSIWGAKTTKNTRDLYAQPIKVTQRQRVCLFVVWFSRRETWKSCFFLFCPYYISKIVWCHYLYCTSSTKISGQGRSLMKPFRALIIRPLVNKMYKSVYPHKVVKIVHLD